MPYAVVFSGGGALGSWEVGCYRALLAHYGQEPPVCVTGASAGALNAAAITAGMSADEIGELWTNLKNREVFAPNITVKAAGWALTRSALTGSLEPLMKYARGKASVFDTRPLEKTLAKIFAGREGKFLGSPIWFAISLTNLTTKSKEMFFKTPPGEALPARFQQTTLPKEQPPEWKPVTGYKILNQALMGTTALPILFPSFESYFDGGVLLNQPISPAIQIMDHILDPDDDADRPVDIFVFIPDPESLGETKNLPAIAATVLTTWLSASLLSQIATVKWRNKLRSQAGKGAIRLCVVRPSADFTAGLLDFGKDVSKLIDQGARDCAARLSRFDPANENTWY
jgi:predicted acylesterase/phospholipase RssA